MISRDWKRTRPGIVYDAAEERVVSLYEGYRNRPVVANAVAVLVDENSKVVGVEGPLPPSDWVMRPLEIPEARRMIVKMSDESYRRTRTPTPLARSRWPVWVDAARRIICIGERDASSTDVVEVAEDVFLSLTREERRRLTAIWARVPDL